MAGDVAKGDLPKVKDTCWGCGRAGHLKAQCEATAEEKKTYRLQLVAKAKVKSTSKAQTAAEPKSTAAATVATATAPPTTTTVPLLTAAAKSKPPSPIVTTQAQTKGPTPAPPQTPECSSPPEQDACRRCTCVKRCTVCGGIVGDEPPAKKRETCQPPAQAVRRPPAQVPTAGSVCSKSRGMGAGKGTWWKSDTGSKGRGWGAAPHGRGRGRGPEEDRYEWVESGYYRVRNA